MDQKSTQVLFLPCTLDGAPGTAASRRFRALWPARYWPESDVYPDLSRPLGDYGAYIFQKAYLSERSQRLIKEARRRGKLLAFDMCDADWELSAEHELRLLRMLPLFDFAVATTEPIAAWMRTYVPTHVILDRLDLAEFECSGRGRPAHEQSEDKPSLCWFGYSHNIAPLLRIAPTIERLGLSLTIISDAKARPWADAIDGARFVEWTLEGANAEIAKHDIALVERASAYKSNNRTITAWALGVVGVETPAELERMLPYDVRLAEQAEKSELVHAHYDVRQSVEQWQGLLEAGDPLTPMQLAARDVAQEVSDAVG